MADNFTICVGTVGTGAWVSSDAGESWRQVRSGLWAESRIFGFAVHPKEPRTILAGADDGVYRREDGGERFERLDSPMKALNVWKVAFDPVDAEIIFAGRRQAAFFCFFFFQAEDGIRDLTVTGVQTCALPISGGCPRRPARSRSAGGQGRGG